MNNQKDIECSYCGKKYNKYGIKNHIWRNHEDGQNFSPNIGYKNGTNKIWNKGLTKETDERVAKGVNTYAKRVKDGSIVSWSSGLTKETDERIKKIAQCNSMAINEKIKNNTWHLSFSRSRTHLYKGIKLHGLWEVAYAKYLDANNIEWARPIEKFEYEFENKKRYYTPDFYLIRENLYIEIKGYPTDKDRAKWKWFPLNLKIIFGKELKEMKIIDNYREIKNAH
jgi:hypothetical protein